MRPRKIECGQTLKVKCCNLLFEMDFQSDILRKYSKQFNAIEKKLRRFQPGVKVVFDKGPLNWHTIELITIVAHRRQRKREAAPWQRKADENEEEEMAVAIKILKRVVLSFRCAKK